LPFSCPWASSIAAQFSQQHTWTHGTNRVFFGRTRHTTQGADAADAGAIACSSSGSGSPVPLVSSST